MSSSNNSKNGTIEYPALPGTSNSSLGTPNSNAVANNDAQGSVNGASSGDTDKNADVASKSASNEGSNAAKENPGQTSGTTRQTRSSAKGGKVAFESLGPTEDLSQKQLREQQHYEIDRIVGGSPDEALGQFHHADKAAMTQVYKQLALLTHPDKQTSDWKEKATKAHSSKQRIPNKDREIDHKTVLNDARDKFDLSTVTPEDTERPKKSHKTFWDTTPFVGSIRRLQIDPSNQKALAFVEKVNSDIETLNKDKGYSPGRGKFPLKYLQDKYQNTQALRKTYKETTDPEQNKELAAIFQTLCVATQEFCEDRGLPETWAWQFADINKEPAWLSEAEGSGSVLNEGNSDDSSGGNKATGDTANGSATESGNDSGDATSSGNVATTGTGTGTGSGSEENIDTEMRDVDEALEKLTLDGEPVISKRQVFKTFQFLIEESSGLHVWKSAQLCGDLKPENIPSVEKPTKEFIAQHKHRYKSMRWIAMSVDDAVTLGAGQYPRISVMVEWLGDLEDTLMTRSDLIRIAGQARIDRDLQSHLPYRKMITFEGRQVFIMSQTEAGLLNGEMKAMQRIKNDQFKAAKANQASLGQPVFPQAGASQSNFAHSGLTQPSFSQPAAPQTGSIQAGFQPLMNQPAVPQPNTAQPGLVQPNTVQQGFAALGQPAIPQAGTTQPAFSQTGPAQPNQADMIPSSAVQAMIANAVQQAIQQYQRQSATPVAA